MCSHCKVLNFRQQLLLRLTYRTAVISKVVISDAKCSGTHKPMDIEDSATRMSGKERFCNIQISSDYNHRRHSDISDTPP